MHLSDATQGMECDGCAKWLGPDNQGTTSEVRSVAQGVCATPSTFSGSANSSVTFIEPVTRDSRRGGKAAEVKQLEAAIGVLGENNIHAKSLHEALRVARNKTKLPPIQEQVESCKSFLERARKRVLRAQAVIDRAVEQKAVCEKEVADGEVRLEALRAQGTNPPPLAVSSLVSELQQKIDNLVKERDALRPCPDDVGVPKISHKWMGQGPPSLENIPPMPTTDVQDLEGWLSDRNCDLRNAMEFGDSSLMAKIGLLVGQGATQLGHLGQDVPMQDHTKSSMMSSLIDAADAKRRCVAAGSACGPTQ